MPAFINMLALVQSMKRRYGMKMVFGTQACLCCIILKLSHDVLTQHHSLERNQASIFCLPARRGANMQVDKGCILGWAGKQKETL